MHVVQYRGAVQRKKLPLKTAKALFVRELVKGRPSVKRIAGAVGVSIAYAYAALGLTPEQLAEVSLGLRPLCPRSPRIPATPAQERLAQIVTEIGAEAVLDYLAANETAVAVTHVDSMPEEDNSSVPENSQVAPVKPPPEDNNDEPADWWKELQRVA
jgi:hypothetical protein